MVDICPYTHSHRIAPSLKESQTYIELTINITQLPSYFPIGMPYVLGINFNPSPWVKYCLGKLAWQGLPTATEHNNIVSENSMMV